MSAPQVTRYNNRNHPMFRGQNCLNTLNLGITTRCSMKCPNCTVDVPGIKARGEAEDALPSEIFMDAMKMQGLRRVHVTGGEPTLHFQFQELCSTLTSWFRCQYLTVETNGFGYRKYKSAFKELFDLVFITHYVKDAVYPGSPDNTEIIAGAQQDLGDKLIVEEPVSHLPAHATIQLGKRLSDFAKGQEPTACSKFFDPGLPAGWYDGRLYRCCVGFGIDKDLGIPVTETWRDEILKLNLGCAACCFRGH